jgi:MFS family permease
LLVAVLTYGANFAPIATCCLVLVCGQMLLSPFVSDAIAALSRGRLVGTYFGIYAVVQGVGAALGNVAGGAAFDLGRVTGYAGVPWLLMIVVGVTCAACVCLLDRSGVLPNRAVNELPGERGQPRQAPAR